jgi:hypothetical protein
LKPNDARPLTDWNVIAVETLRTDATKSVPEAWLYMGFVQAAVYDAVVGIRGGFEPYSYDQKPLRPASPTAAAMAAAHRVLVEYRPGAKQHWTRAWQPRSPRSATGRQRPTASPSARLWPST